MVVATRPIVTTEPVTGIGPTQARLQGTVNPRASQTWALVRIRPRRQLRQPNPADADGQLHQCTAVWLPGHRSAPVDDVSLPRGGHQRPGADRWSRHDLHAARTFRGAPRRVRAARSHASAGRQHLGLVHCVARALEVRVRSSNPVLLPASGLASEPLWEQPEPPAGPGSEPLRLRAGDRDAPATAAVPPLSPST